VSRVLIIGGGPTGLGAAYALEASGHHDWVLLERDTVAGGLSRSFVDDHGYTWDIGGHVLFSHYEEFDAAIAQALQPDGWVEHVREAWIRLDGMWVPYPFQNNLHRLPAARRADCLAGLVSAALDNTPGLPDNFAEYQQRTFGPGIADAFMRPYNEKVWAYPLSELAWQWTGDRVSVPDPVRAVRNAVLGIDDVGWGPNNLFRFPLEGGTGGPWRAVAQMLPQDRIRYGVAVESVDLQAHLLELSDGSGLGYDSLVSTMPLDLLANSSGEDDLSRAAAPLRHSSVNVIGIGMKGDAPESVRGKCWMYFPDPAVPFYRVTHFSHYSSNNVPAGGNRWSLMAEVSESPHRTVDQAVLGERCVECLRREGMIPEGTEVESIWTHRVEYGYPTPSLGRDTALAYLLHALARHDVFSRGRFGGWKYEVGNMDHSFMQGVEVARLLVAGDVEKTLFDPESVNTHR